MRTILAALAAASFCLPVHADSEARHGADYVRVSVQPCTDEATRAVIALAGEDPADYRAARAEMGGQTFAGCWRPDFQRRIIFLRYEDGDAGMLPFDALKPVRTT